jgi:hypothetical protein
LNRSVADVIVRRAPGGGFVRGGGFVAIVPSLAR